MAASGSPGLNTHSLSYKKYARNANTLKMIIPKNAKLIKRKFPDMYKKEELFIFFFCAALLPGYPHANFQLDGSASASQGLLRIGRTALKMRRAIPS